MREGGEQGGPCSQRGSEGGEKRPPWRRIHSEPRPDRRRGPNGGVCRSTSGLVGATPPWPIVTSRGIRMTDVFTATESR